MTSQTETPPKGFRASPRRNLHSPKTTFRLDPETLLLEYALGDKRSYLWAVTQTTITGYELPARAEIEPAARHFYNLAKDNAKSEEIEQSAARLSQMLLAPAIEQMGKPRLAIVADGALQYIPFAALPKPGQKAKGGRQKAVNAQSDYHPLIIDHEIVMLPSASTLAILGRETRDRALAPKLVAVLAGPVFSSEDVRVRRASAEAANSEKQSTAPEKGSGLCDPLKRQGWPAANGRFQGCSEPDARRRQSSPWLRHKRVGRRSISKRAEIPLWAQTLASTR